MLGLAGTEGHGRRCAFCSPQQPRRVLSVLARDQGEFVENQPPLRPLRAYLPATTVTSSSRSPRPIDARKHSG
jgi:hypothetical protein